MKLVCTLCDNTFKNQKSFIYLTIRKDSGFEMSITHLDRFYRVDKTDAVYYEHSSAIISPSVGVKVAPVAASDCYYT